MLFSQHKSKSKRAASGADLSRRERQIMDILYQSGRATVSEVQAALPDPPSYSAVRAMLRVLEGKGQIRHEEESLRYVFLPVVARDKAKFSALKHLLETFFDGSAEQAVATLLDGSTAKLSREQLNRLSQLIEKAKQEGV
jgi:BlaI family transcriptional regulator, penicillinase repressor